MLTTRLWMGSLLAALAVGMLVFDQSLGPWFPFLFVFQMILALVGCRELLGLLGRERFVEQWVCYAGVLTLTAANWIVHLIGKTGAELTVILAVSVGWHLLIYVVEMARFEEPGKSFERMARTWWVIAYLGLLPSFFAQIRWLYPMGSDLGTAALAMAIFVPKGCDIGAYFTGRLVGRHKMTPTLSPKKTWEGAFGGLLAACLASFALDRVWSAAPLHGCIGCEIGFGLTVGGSGMLGDLAESLLKRDCEKKDASTVLPGFGGVLDLVDAVIFAAPVAYWWFLVR